MNWKQTDITTGKQKFCSITKIKAYTILGRIDKQQTCIGKKNDRYGKRRRSL